MNILIIQPPILSLVVTVPFLLIYWQRNSPDFAAILVLILLPLAMWLIPNAKISTADIALLSFVYLFVTVLSTYKFKAPLRPRSKQITYIAIFVLTLISQYFTQNPFSSIAPAYTSAAAGTQTLATHTIPNLRATISPAILPKLIPYMPEKITLSGRDQPKGFKYYLSYAPSRNSMKAMANDKDQAYAASGVTLFIFAQEDGWYLVEYKVTSGGFRIGYTNSSDFPLTPGVPFLEKDGRTVYTKYTCDLTDDPRETHRCILTIPKDTEVQLINRYDDQWIYIETTYKDRLVRGFVDESAIKMP